MAGRADQADHRRGHRAVHVVEQPLRPGDVLLSVDGTAVATFEFYAAAEAMPSPEADAGAGGAGRRHLDLTVPYALPALIGWIFAPLAGEARPACVGDVVVAADGMPMVSFDQFRDGGHLGRPDAGADGAALRQRVDAGGRRSFKAHEGGDGGFEKRAMIGAASAPLYLPATETPAPWTASRSASNADDHRTIGGGDRGDGVRRRSASTTCRPIGIAQISGHVASQGFVQFLAWIGIVSMIGFLNLFPIPVLDGGPSSPSRSRRCGKTAEPCGDAGRDVDWSWLDPAADGICNLQRHHAHGELTNRAANRPGAEGGADAAAAGSGQADPRLLLIAALLTALLPSPLTLAQGTAVFSRVDVAGNQRIEADTIRSYAGIEPGQPVTPEQLNLAVRACSTPASSRTCR